MEDASRLLKIPESECPDVWIPTFKTLNDRNHGPVWKTQLFHLDRNLYGHPLAGLLWERQSEEVLLKLGRYTKLLNHAISAGVTESFTKVGETPR